MPKLIKDGAIISDERWQPAQPDAECAATGHIATLSQWQALPDKAGSALQLEPGDGIEPLLPHLDEIAMVAVNFPVFTDGRGFSYARELRERGYAGEVWAVGAFLRDQLHYLRRCGFDAFQMADESLLEDAIASFDDFDEHYQAAIDQPLPLFRRRA
ncbi:MAG: DUF934 domain-containing protein [Paracoccus sp. (in: a-proteobacteria)]